MKIITLIAIIILMAICCTPTMAMMNGAENNQEIASPAVSIIHDDLTITDITTYYAEPAKGKIAIMLGERKLNSNPYWSKPIRAYIVPAGNYASGQKLERIPEGALPFEVFFAINQFNADTKGLYHNYELHILTYK